MQRILFIEDEPASIEPVTNKVDQDRYEYRIINFIDAKQQIKEFAPDIVVLDLIEDGSSAEPSTPGLLDFDWIWEHGFCPIIVYSAQSILLEESKNHPFVARVQKGKNSEQLVLSAIAAFEPHVTVLHEAKELIAKEFAVAMREIAPLAFDQYPNKEETVNRTELIRRGGRRRLAALMDEQSRHGESLAPWEQYLCPPINKDLQLGDILLEIGKPSDNPSSYRVVLTPSCDMVTFGGRQPKVANILVAQCYSIKNAINVTSIRGTKKIKDKLPSPIISQGYFETIVPFPALEKKIPSMAADLRILELIPFSDIDSAGGKFIRIASVDSPFREVIAWAYQATACRPGLPDRDLDKWGKEIIKKYEAD